MNNCNGLGKIIKRKDQTHVTLLHVFKNHQIIDLASHKTEN